MTDACIFYTTESGSFNPKEMLPFSNKFTVLCGLEETGDMLGIMIISSYRKLELLATSAYDFGMFISAVREAMRKSPYT